MAWKGNQEPIGGQGVEVEIDETLMARRKYNRGRISQQVWVFGGIERESKRKIIVPLTDGQEGLQRNKETLIPIIKKYIKPGSVIYSDKWGAYSTLSSHGYTHYQINHSANFVDPQDCSIHTQNIESLWRCFKKHSKRPGMQTAYMEQYVLRFLFLQNFERKD